MAGKTIICGFCGADFVLPQMAPAVKVPKPTWLALHAKVEHLGDEDSPTSPQLVEAAANTRPTTRAASRPRPAHKQAESEVAIYDLAPDEEPRVAPKRTPVVAAAPATPTPVPAKSRLLSRVLTGSSKQAHK